MDKKLKIASEDQRLVGGEVYIPNVPDSDGEFMDAAGIQEMAYKFMKNLKLKQIDVSHNNQLVDKACVVESFIARKGDPDFIEGAWVCIVHVPDDDTWSKIKKGHINGFSMEAMVSKEATYLEFDVPPVVKGMTMKEDNHEHEFHVAYDPEGNFLGGRTSIVNGHWHEVKKGTVTEMAGNHRHRFSHLEVLKQAAEGAMIEKQDIADIDLSLTVKAGTSEGAVRAWAARIGSHIGGDASSPKMEVAEKIAEKIYDSIVQGGLDLMSLADKPDQMSALISLIATALAIKDDATGADLETAGKLTPEGNGRKRRGRGCEPTQKDDIGGGDLGSGGAKSAENVMAYRKKRLVDFLRYV